MLPANDRRIGYLWHSVALGSIRAAADALDLDPSGLSKQISLLEREMGTALLERHNRGVKATEAGEVLVNYHREQMSRFDDMVERIKEIRGVRSGHLRLAMGEGFVSDLMSGVLKNFTTAHPGVKVDVSIGGTNEVIRQVTTDEAVIGLVYNPPHDPTVRVRSSKVGPLCAIVNPSHPLTGLKQKPKLSDLHGFPLVAKPVSFGTRQLLENAARSDGLSLQFVITSTSSTVLYQYTEDSNSIAFGPAFAVRREVATGALVAIEIDHPALKRASAHLITRTGRNLSPSAHRMMEHLRLHLAALQ